MILYDALRNLPANTLHTIAGVGYQDGVPAQTADAGWPMGVVRSAAERWFGELIVIDYQAIVCGALTRTVSCIAWRVMAFPATVAMVARPVQPVSLVRTT